MAQGRSEMLEASLRLLASQAVRFLNPETQKEGCALESPVYGAAGRLVPWMQPASASRLMQRMMVTACCGSDGDRWVLLLCLLEAKRTSSWLQQGSGASWRHLQSLYLISVDPLILC